jgi:hypothetical protein
MSRLGRRIPDQARVAPRRVGDRRGAPCSAAERELIANEFVISRHIGAPSLRSFHL